MKAPPLSCRIIATIGICATAWLHASQAQVVIDSFNAGPFSLTGSGGNISEQQVASSSDIAGGQRRVTLFQESNQFLPHSTVSLQLGDGFLNYDREQNVSLLLEYGAYESIAMNLNLAANGADRFQLVLSQVPGAFSFRFTVRDNSFFQTESVSILTGTGPGTYDVLFTGFSGVDFSKIGAIRMEFEQNVQPANGSGTYRFDSFETFTPVPEPQNAAAFCAIGLLAFYYRRRKPSLRPPL